MSLGGVYSRARSHVHAVRPDDGEPAMAPPSFSFLLLAILNSMLTAGSFARDLSRLPPTRSRSRSWLSCQSSATCTLLLAAIAVAIALFSDLPIALSKECTNIPTQPKFLNSNLHNFSQSFPFLQPDLATANPPGSRSPRRDRLLLHHHHRHHHHRHHHHSYYRLEDVLARVRRTLTETSLDKEPVPRQGHTGNIVAKGEGANSHRSFVEDSSDVSFEFKSSSSSSSSSLSSSRRSFVEDSSSSLAFLHPVELHDVRLHPDSPQGMAQETNLDYLLMLDVNRLVWSFRKTAGLLLQDRPYGGWEDPKSELRGHFVGHYLSASAMMWASTGNRRLFERMKDLVEALAECQKAIGSGYLSAFPEEFFDRFEAIKPVWAPYYTIHKIMAGLLDQYLFVGNKQALGMVVDMATYFGDRVKNVIARYTIERHWQSLNEEVGGMNDVLYRLYTVTKNPEHLELAHLFDKPCFLGPLALKVDELSGYHVNTHIPVVIGAQMRYEVTHDVIYKGIAEFFMESVNASHTYASGGTSAWEFWQDPKRLGNTLQQTDQESCTTHNMLKVARNLFRWSRNPVYAEYYERALTNGVLGIQRGPEEPGVMIYFLPMGPGNSKARGPMGWGKPFESFWCCYGTGIESFSKLGDSVYFQQWEPKPALYVTQFVSSDLTWTVGGLSVKQTVTQPTSVNPVLTSVLSFVTLEGASMKSAADVYVRIPGWAKDGSSKAILNGKSLSETLVSGSFVKITRDWKTGDKLEVNFTLTLRTERIQDDRPEFRQLHAILFGPYLLAGMSSGDCDLAPGINASRPEDWIVPVPEDHRAQLATLILKPWPFVTLSETALANDAQSVTKSELQTRADDHASPDGGSKDLERIESYADDEDRRFLRQLGSQLNQVGGKFNGRTLSLQRRGGYLVAAPEPLEGTNEAAASRFWLVSSLSTKLAALEKEGGPKTDSRDAGDEKSSWRASGKESNNRYGPEKSSGDVLAGNEDLVSFESLERPGYYMVHADNGSAMMVEMSEGRNLWGSQFNAMATFKRVPGEFGYRTASFESIVMPGYLLSMYNGRRDLNTPTGWTVSFQKRRSTWVFVSMSSFYLREGEPPSDVSFVARGRNQKFPLFPISAFKDETYTTYFRVPGGPVR
ncbi:hypothetical protein CBR_g3815 [Chara braunii]|uniref:Uncharacterized protein n=1 Tax=Chara braunii TaxID=69332 RepID=A0A388KGJ2_CHABU|nr:hypothetical protein CBR_g3815 [Chara braunii]|eukprot:GBG69117.1 hypothetical protein CBR_g3815 [Chara braunii]